MGQDIVWSGLFEWIEDLVVGLMIFVGLVIGLVYLVAIRLLWPRRTAKPPVFPARMVKGPHEDEWAPKTEEDAIEATER